MSDSVKSYMTAQEAMAVLVPLFGLEGRAIRSLTVRVEMDNPVHLTIEEIAKTEGVGRVNS